MKSSFLATAIAALVLTAGVAKAEVLPDFQVQEGAISGVSHTFTADKLTGPYAEKFTVTSVDGFGNGTFISSAYFTIQGFSKNDGANAVAPVQLNSMYGLYGIFNASGTISGIGTSTVTFTGSTGSFSLYSDAYAGGVSTTLGFVGLNATTLADSADDKLLASTSTVQSGAGSIHPGTLNKGDFAIVFGDLVLSALGAQYFFDPSPFYVTAKATGQLDTFDLSAGTTTDLTGSVDIHFNVPEPGTIALVGVALLAVGGVARKRMTKA